VAGGRRWAGKFWSEAGRTASRRPGGRPRAIEGGERERRGTDGRTDGGLQGRLRTRSAMEEAGRGLGRCAAAAAAVFFFLAGWLAGWRQRRIYAGGERGEGGLLGACRCAAHGGMAPSQQTWLLSDPGGGSAAFDRAARELSSAPARRASRAGFSAANSPRRSAAEACVRACDRRRR